MSHSFLQPRFLPIAARLASDPLSLRERPTFGRCPGVRGTPLAQEPNGGISASAPSPRPSPRRRLQRRLHAFSERPGVAATLPHRVSDALVALLAAGGCHDLTSEAQQGPAPLAKDPPNNGLRKGAAANPAGPAAPTAPPSTASADRAALAHGQWNQAVEMSPAEAEETEPTRDASLHWRHPPLEDILGRPAADRLDLRPLLADKDAVVAGNAAIGLARLGDAGGAGRLAATVRAAGMRLSMRCGRRSRPWRRCPTPPRWNCCENWPINTDTSRRRNRRRPTPAIPPPPTAVFPLYSRIARRVGSRAGAAG